jgi:hypothetical protein
MILWFLKILPCVKNWECSSIYLCSDSERRELAFDNSHVWFKKFIDHWFRIAHQKALARITKAVEIDQVGALESLLPYYCEWVSEDFI